MKLFFLFVFSTNLLASHGLGGGGDAGRISSFLYFLFYPLFPFEFHSCVYMV